MICLDTNVIISLINRRSQAVRDRFDAQIAARTQIVLPVISLFEMRYGHARSDRRAESDRRLELLLARGVSVVAFDADDAAHVGAHDILVAAQARSWGRHSGQREYT
jgi:tRNA(fMet)-specific endonuclease VapC